MKLIFLDIDGVLNHSGCKTRTPQGYYFIEEDRTRRLRQIMDATGARVVLSSSWRKGYYDHEAGIGSADAADYLLLERTLSDDYGIELIGYTPMHDTAYRGREILEWLEHFTDETVESLVILDDDKDMEPLGRFLVRTSFFLGLEDKHVTRAIEVLTQESYPQFMQDYVKQRRNESGKKSAQHSRVKG